MSRGLGLLYGSPLVPLTPDVYKSAEKLAAWIEREIPSFVGKVPVKYTEAMLGVLRGYATDEMIRGALVILKRKGTQFEYPTNFTEHDPLAPRQPEDGHQHLGQGPISKAERLRQLQFTLEVYEHRFVLAVKTNNAQGAEAILIEVLKILWAMLQGHGEAKSMMSERNVLMQEWRELNKDVTEAFERAHTLETHVRHLTRAELFQMRGMPRPDGIQSLRLPSRLMMRAAAGSPARRPRR
jgi:hypothetical protein